MNIKRNNNYNIFRLVISNVFALIVCSVGKFNFTITAIIWFIIVVVANFMLSFTKNLKAIELKDDKLCLIFSEYFKEVIEFYNYSDLKYTYKNEIGGKGSVSMEFRIYKKDCYDTLIISIGGTFDGWSDDKIYKIIEELNKLGIEVIE